MADQRQVLFHLVPLLLTTQELRDCDFGDEGSEWRGQGFELLNVGCVNIERS